MTPKQLRSAAHALRTAANALEDVTTQLRALSAEIDTPDNLNDTEGPRGTAAVATPSERRLAASIAAHESWANTPDRAARTAAARRGLDQKFLDQAGGDPVRAEHLRKAHFQRLALKSARARRRAREETEAAQQAEAELTATGGDAE